MSKSKKQNKKKNKKSSLRRIIIIFALVCLIGATAYTAVSIIRTKENAEVTRGELKDENILMTVDNAQLSKGFALSDGNVVVTTNSFISFKSDGTIRATDKLGYAKPVVKTADNKYLVFERSTGKYAILNRSGVVYHNDAGSEIVNGDISKSGNYAIITRKTQASTVLNVYSSSNKLLFSWECTDEYLNLVALSPNGKTVAVATAGVKNGEAYSKVLYFYIDSSDIEGEMEYAGENIYAMKFTGNKEVGVVTDLSYMIVDLKELKSNVISYDYDILSGFFFNDNSNIAVLKQEFGTLDKTILTVTNSNGENIFEKEFSNNVIDFKIDKKNVYVMTMGEIHIYSLSSGDEKNVITTNGGLKSIFVNDNCIYCLSDIDIFKYDF